MINELVPNLRFKGGSFHPPDVQFKCKLSENGFRWTVHIATFLWLIQSTKYTQKHEYAYLSHCTPGREEKYPEKQFIQNISCNSPRIFPAIHPEYFLQFIHNVANNSPKIFKTSHEEYFLQFTKSLSRILMKNF